MNRYAKKIVVLSLVGVMGATTLTGCGKLDGTQTVATIGEDKLSLGTASVFLRLQQANFYTALKSYLGPEIWTQPTGEDEKTTYADSTKASVLESIEEYALTKQHAAEFKITLTEEDQTKIAEAAKAFMADNEASVLEKAGISEADVVTYLELNTYYIRVKKAIEDTVDTNVTDEEAKQSSLTMVRVSTGATVGEDGTSTELTAEEKSAKKEVAERVLVAIKEATDDEDIDAKIKNIDETLSASKVSYGSDDEKVDKAILDAVKGLEEGTIVDKVIEGTDGYYVVRFDSEFDEKATDEKKESIITERKNKAYADKIEEWKKGEEFKVDKKVWKKAKIENSKAYTIKVEEQPTEGPALEGPAPEEATPEVVPGE